MYYVSITAVLHECLDLLQSSQSCLASEGVWAEETMEDGMCQPTKMTASDFSELGTSTVQVRNPNMPA